MNCLLTGTPDQQINPPEDKDDGEIIYSASEVADNILENGFMDFDYGYWPDLTDAEKASAWDSLISEFACFNNIDGESLAEFKAERDTLVKQFLFGQLEWWAQREINRLPRNGLAK